MGYHPPAEGIAPEFLVDTTHALLTPYDRWIEPIGLGAPLEAGAWERFVARCRELGMPGVSVWRYGVADAGVLGGMG